MLAAKEQVFKRVAQEGELHDLKFHFAFDCEAAIHIRMNRKDLAFHRYMTSVQLKNKQLMSVKQNCSTEQGFMVQMKLYVCFIKKRRS